MAHRFTDSRKWDDDWFIDLPNEFKLMWIYVLDKCDHAGIYKHSEKLSTLLIGKIDLPRFIEICNGRLIDLGKNKYFISKFIEFQYKVQPDDLDPTNRCHKSVIDILKKEGAYKGLTRPLQGCKDKKQEKDKDYIGALKSNPAYKHINIDNELLKMDAWLSAHPGRKKVPRFIVNWLNKIETPIETPKKKERGDV